MSKILDHFQINIIKARTGSGKSTDLTWQLYLDKGPLLSVQPRVQNATGISAWMNQTGRKSGCITGARKSPSNQLDYCTTGCAFKLILSGIYNTIVFDEIQDATAETLNLLLVAVKTVPNIVIMSATIPKWCYNLGSQVEILKPTKRNYNITSKFGIDLDEVIDGSKNVHFRNSLENTLTTGNVLFFINGKTDFELIDELYGHDIDSILDQTSSQKLIVFRGTDDNARMIQQIRDGQFPPNGVLIISNVSLGTGVTIPYTLNILRTQLQGKQMV
jgi:HrpA-like RNA helicase